MTVQFLINIPFLITAFALKPRLLLLDEPEGGLDFQSTEYLYRQISGYKEHGTVLFSSHILESITLTSDRVFVLEDGRIRQTSEHGDLLRHPRKYVVSAGMLLLAGAVSARPVLLYALLVLLAVESLILFFVCRRHPE